MFLHLAIMRWWSLLTCNLNTLLMHIWTCKITNKRCLYFKPALWWQCETCIYTIGASSRQVNSCSWSCGKSESPSGYIIMMFAVWCIALAFVYNFLPWTSIQRKEMDTPVSPISLYEEFLSSLKSNSSHDSPVMSLDKMSGSHDKRMDIWRLDPLAQHYISYLPMKLGEQLKGWLFVEMCMYIIIN